MGDEAITGEILQRVQFFVEEGIPFNRFLGLRCEDLGPGTATLRMPFREELIGDPHRPALHGGTLSALADTAGGAALFSDVDLDARVSTIDLRIDYLRPGRLDDVWAEAKVVRRGNRVGVTRITVWQNSLSGDSKEHCVIAEATGVYSVRLSSTG
jgi:uncharacterized protein (TIGR00369 family)